MILPKLKTLFQPTARLDKIQQLLVPHLEPESTFVKTWFWKEHTLVFEFATPNGVKYGIDLALTGKRATLSVVGRDDPSRYSVRVRLGSFGKPIKKSQRRRVGNWQLPITNRDLVLETLARINRVVALMSQEPAVAERSIPAYWWDEKSNFGDQITPWLIEMMTGRPAYNTIGLPLAGQAVMAAGSIITGMNRGDMTVWGSGLISPLDDSRVEVLKHRAPRRITAVRGEFTHAELTKKLGWEVPAVFGDPALLLPSFFKPHSRPELSKLPALVPHYAHRNLLPKTSESSGFETVDVRKSPEVVVSQIANASSIVSTSLHGLIIAQTYGVPWIWLRISDQDLVGDDFKFKDFFSTIDAPEISSVEVTKKEAPNVDILDLAARALLPQPRYSVEALVDAFPRELVPFIPGTYVENSPSVD